MTLTEGTFEGPNDNTDYFCSRATHAQIQEDPRERLNN